MRFTMTDGRKLEQAEIHLLNRLTALALESSRGMSKAQGIDAGYVWATYEKASKELLGVATGLGLDAKDIRRAANENARLAWNAEREAA